MSLLLERNEGRHQKTLQNMCNKPATQTTECEIRKKKYLDHHFNPWILSAWT